MLHADWHTLLAMHTCTSRAMPIAIGNRKTMTYIACGSTPSDKVDSWMHPVCHAEFPLPRGCTGENGWAVAVVSVSVVIPVHKTQWHT